MEIKEITNQSIWQKFFDEAGSPSFLQSWQWGVLQKNLGCDILRLGLYNKEKLVAITLVEKVVAKRGKFLFMPHGPILKFSPDSIEIQFSIIKSLITQLLNYLITLARKEGFFFIRIAPVFEDKPEYRRIFQDLGFKTAPIYIHSERCWLLDLNKTEEELLTDMRKTTRYSIRKAERDGVIIEKRTDQKAVNDFLTIYAETAKREKFVPFSKDYIQKEFEAFHKTGNALFLFGNINNKAKIPVSASSDYLASALILFTKSTAFYHQGASIHTKIPVTYLLQWEAIKEAKKRGCRFYNFWGILKESRTPKNWAGLSLFKTGFGGFQLDYLPTQDYIISPKYYLTYLYEKFLAWKRGV